jgi:uroporphyrinogen decarboxylase
VVHTVLRDAADFVLKAITMAIDRGIDAFVMPGDFAYERGLLFSLHDYHTFLKPLHREIVETVHQRGSMIVKHSDGNVWALLDEWIEVGFDGFHPVQPQCMDIQEVKKYVSGRMALIGNIDCRTLLVEGTEEEVRKTVKETIQRAAPGGGYIISSSNSIHPNCKPENYITMVEAAHEYGAVY